MAANDTTTTGLNTPITINVLANDSGLQDVPITLSLMGSPSHGSATINADQSITYTPATDFAGQDLFTYKVTDANGDMATATVTVTVNCTTCATATLTLAWDPSAQAVQGYRVYYGSTATTATQRVTDLTTGSTGFNASAPSVKFNAWNDLRLRTGDQVCFRVTAYNNTGESGYSAPVCAGL
ncbi:MAG: hypothetical protein B7Z66_10205 [Chromatiales bacterium 21-64-14]|nr:MAG: hypothetical protein B7Z66_10205 [Chromatiales bacterium 21-64-14]